MHSTMWLFFVRIRKAPVAAGNATDAPLMNGRVFLKSFFWGVSSGNSFRPFPWTFHCFLLLVPFGDVFRFHFSASLLLCCLLLLCFSLFFDSILSCFSAVCFFLASLLFFFSLFCFSCFSALVLVCFSAFFACLLFLCFFCCPVSCDQERKRLPGKLDKIIQKSSKHRFHTISLYSSLG